MTKDNQKINQSINRFVRIETDRYQKLRLHLEQTSILNKTKPQCWSKAYVSNKFWSFFSRIEIRKYFSEKNNLKKKIKINKLDLVFEKKKKYVRYSIEKVVLSWQWYSLFIENPSTKSSLKLCLFFHFNMFSMWKVQY